MHGRLSLALALALLLSISQTGRAQTFWSLGFKVGYTFGDDGGITGGVEASYMLSPLYGFTLDLTGWPKSHTSIHAGLEGWWWVGLDVGPTVFLSDQYKGLGFSAIVWDGLFFYPYYELAIPFRGSPYHSVGGYIKFPVNLPPDYFDVG